MSVLQFIQTIRVGGQKAGLFAVLPLGELSVDFNHQGGTRTAPGTGTGDLVLGGVFGPVGSPALSLPDYLAHDPGASLGVLAKVGLPSGTCGPDRLANLGGNRVWGHFGLPMGYSLGTSYLDPKLTTCELLPSGFVWGDSDDPFGPATSTGQGPLWMVEAHDTRNLSRAFWVSLDAVYLYGGQTSTNGVANDDRRRSLGMGGDGISASAGQCGAEGDLWRNRQRQRGRPRVAASCGRSGSRYSGFVRAYSARTCRIARTTSA